MARVTRTAAPDTEAAVLEDLRAIRASGGLHRATPDGLRVTLAMMFPEDATFTEAHVAHARAMLEMHINRGCHNYGVRQPGDACARAAAVSLRRLLLPPAGDTTKAAAVHRQVLAECQCTLQTDGLRKREDQVMATIATTAFAELKIRKEGSGPQTIEEVVHLMRPIASELREQLHDGLQEIYGSSDSSVGS